jgi:uncharacterized protein (DUF1697 family)
MSHVALFRNLNLGRPGSPTGEELVAAFGGTGLARTFQTNGTVLFRSDHPEAIVREALKALRDNGHHHGVAVRSLTELKQVITDVPAADPADNIYRTMISFYDVDQVPTVDLPKRSGDELVELRRLDLRNAVSACWKPQKTAGDTTGFLEALLGVLVTTRTLGTLQRLVTAAPKLGYQ